MLRQLTSHQLAETEAYLRIESQPNDPETEQQVRDQKLRDLFARFRKKPKKG